MGHTVYNIGSLKYELKTYTGKTKNNLWRK